MIKKNPKVLLVLLISTLILSACNSNQKPNNELTEVEGVEIPFSQQTQFQYIFDDTTSFQIQNIDTSLHKRLIQDALQENLQVYQSDSLTKRGNPYQIAKRLDLLQSIKDSALHLDKTKKHWLQIFH
jgi:PBP1b-binding outer membrane lipoprotein LpoB